MSFSFIANLLLVLAILGVLAIFLRKIPETIASSEKPPDGEAAESEPATNFAMLNIIFSAVRDFLVQGANALWHFMLEAKDLKQSQIIAAKFARLVTPKARLQNIGAYNNLKKAQSLAAQSRHEEAEQLYIQIIRKHNHEFQAYEGLLEIYLAQRKYDQALEVLRFLLEHNQEHDGYMAQLGNIYLLMRRFPESAQWYLKSVQINGLVAARLVNLAKALHGCGSTAEAAGYMRQAVDLEPANVQYLLMFVGLLKELGEYPAAIAALQKGLELNAANPELQRELLYFQDLDQGWLPK